MFLLGLGPAQFLFVRRLRVPDLGVRAWGLAIWGFGDVGFGFRGLGVQGCPESGLRGFRDLRA